MKKIIFIIGIFTFMCGLSACKSKESNKQTASTAVASTSDNSMNSLNWEGTYTGITPCADCSGIYKQIILNKDNTYSMKMQYLDKMDSVYSYTGTFQWDDAGSIITLSGLKEESTPSQYRVGENTLMQLDMEGNIITGTLASKYVLQKVNEALVEKNWKLYELLGVDDATMKSQSAKNVRVTFQIEGNRISGNSGCNNFSGIYELAEGNRIAFSAMVSTRKMCIDMVVEETMSQLFPKVDNYTLQDNILSLNQGDTAVIRFISE